MKKSYMLTPVLVSVFGFAAVTLSFYGDIVGIIMTAAAGIALFLNFSPMLLRWFFNKGQKSDTI